MDRNAKGQFVTGHGVRGWREPRPYGYAGKYGDLWLRSSPEYAYALYLDFHKAQWLYEAETYTLKSGQRCRPDFFILDDQGRVTTIVEVKGNHPSRMAAAEQKIDLLRELLPDVHVELLTEKDLVDLFRREMPMRYYTAVGQWRQAATLGGGVSNRGANNPMSGKHHTAATKALISEKAKIRCQQPEYRAAWARVVEMNRQSGWAAVKRPRVAREKRTCPTCGSTFQVTVTSKRRHCSGPCASRANAPRGSQRRGEVAAAVHKQIAAFIEAWAQEHAGELTAVKMNSLQGILGPIREETERRFGIKDFRILSAAVFGEDRGRKALVTHMMVIAENARRDAAS